MRDYEKLLIRIQKQISLELTTTQMKLSNINLTKELVQYKSDILDLANSSVNLLANCYMESDSMKKDKFDWLMEKVITDKKLLKEVRQELKNIYYLNKNNLTKTSQYFNAKKKVVDFILLLKDCSLDDLNVDDKFRELSNRVKDLKKLNRYFSGNYLNTSVRNIDNFYKLIMSLGLTDEDKTLALEMVLINDVNYFNKELNTSMNKNSRSYKLKLKKKNYGEFRKDLASSQFIYNCLMKSGLDKFVKLDMLEDNVSLKEREYHSIIAMLKDDPNLDPKDVFNDFYRKWDIKE